MTDVALIRVVDLPFCQALMLERWDAPPGRFFVGYRTRHGFAALLGDGVVNEFRTISGPILLSPTTLLGGVYDAGMRLADARDIDAPIDQGWPPLTVGVDVVAPPRPDNWMSQFLDAMRTEAGEGPPPWEYSLTNTRAEHDSLSGFRCHANGRVAATIIVTDAPLLPQQQEQLADVDDAPITIAVSTGNRLPRITANELQTIAAVSERRLAVLSDAARDLF